MLPFDYARWKLTAHAVLIDLQCLEEPRLMAMCSTSAPITGRTVSPCLAITAPPARRPTSPVSSTICTAEPTNISQKTVTPLRERAQWQQGANGGGVSPRGGVGVGGSCYIPRSLQPVCAAFWLTVLWRLRQVQPPRGTCIGLRQAVCTLPCSPSLPISRDVDWQG